MCIILLFSSESKAIKKKLTEQKVFIFLDEIQKLPDFQNQIKVFYDLYPNLKLFLSGSTSLFIRKKAQESLAGRILNLFLTPLNFEEYLLFSHNLDLIDRPSIFQKEIERQFEIYLTSQFIDSLNMGEIDLKKDYFKSIIKKIIFEDIPSIFPIEYPEVLMRLVKIIAQHPGIYLSESPPGFFYYKGWLDAKGF